MYVLFLSDCMYVKVWLLREREREREDIRGCRIIEVFEF